MRVAIVGAGAIGSFLADRIVAGAAGTAQLVAIADLPERRDFLTERATRLGCRWFDDPAAVLGERPDVVVEAVSPTVVRSHALAWLEGGADALIMSVGALVDADLLDRLGAAASRLGRHVLVPSGAVGGLDVLRAASIEGLAEVELRTTKPPAALRGAPHLAQLGIDIDAIQEPTIVFDGPAAEAVVAFPANLNVVAALSLAGIGPHRTRVVLVADPSVTRNIHEVRARGTFGELYLRLENEPSPDNARTSLLAPLSALALLRRRAASVQVGS